MADLLPPLKPIAIKERLSILFIEKGQLDVLDGAFVVVDKSGVCMHIPVGGVACLMLEPGTRTSHAAVALGGAGGHAAGVGRRSWGAFVFVRTTGRREAFPVFPTRVGMNLLRFSFLGFPCCVPPLAWG